MSMSDAGAAWAATLDDDTGGGDAPAEASAATAPADTPAAGASAPEQAPAADVDETEKGPVPWGEHKKAADEAARYRTELRSYQEAFEGWTPDDAKVLLTAIRGSSQLLSAGRASDAAAIFREIANVFGPEAADAVQDAAEADANDDGDDDEILTRADVERLLAERDQHAEYERGVQSHMQEIHSAAQELGIDPQSEEWASVLSNAINLYDGDVRAAHAAMKARDQQIIDQYLNGKVGVADRIPAGAGNGSSATPETSKPQTITEAGERFRQFLDSGG